MGSFNVTCCVTKTPITIGEKCVLILVNKTENDLDTLTCGEMHNFIIESGIKGVYHGKYDDYGRLDVDHPDCNNDEKYRGYFISSDAWELAVELFKNPNYKGQLKWIEDRFQLKKQIAKLMEAKKQIESSDLAKEVDVMVSAVEAITGGAVGIDEDSAKRLIVLKSFCYTNNFNMFDPSFENWYGSQSLNVREKKQWNKLRNARIKVLEDLEKKWENE
jgi:hypothetical protein